MTTWHFEGRKGTEKEDKWDIRKMSSVLLAAYQEIQLHSSSIVGKECQWGNVFWNG